MRVVGGEWCGMRLFEPKGTDITRPTTDRVREAMASMIASARPDGIEGAHVLDAFAGTGALGIELLSRGADRAVFCDADRAAIALITKNLEHVRAPRERWAIVRGDTLKRAHAGRIAGGPFDIVLLDPPYALEADVVAALLEDLARCGLLAAGALAVVEHAAATPGARPAGFTVLREKRYGITAVDLLQQTDEVPADGDAR